MLREKTLIFCFLLTVMTFLTSYGQCENWKEFFNNSNSTWYYDKDSIHYPKQKKNIFGFTVQNKEIVNIWIRNKDSEGFGEPIITRIYCVERECDGCSNLIFPDSNKLSGIQYPIEPGSRVE